MLKIIKISDGVFRHVIEDDKGNDVFFYNTNDTTISIDLGTIKIVSGGYDRFFRLNSIEVYDNETLIATATIEVFIAALINLGYSPIVNATVSLASINTKTPALDNNRVPVLPSMTNGGNLAVTTNATGTTYTAFASQACKQLTISNQSGVVIEVRQGGGGVALQIPTGAFYTFFGITNANQLDVRRVDVSNTQITITARWEA